MIVLVPSGFEMTCCWGRTVGSSNSSSSAQFALLYGGVSSGLRRGEEREGGYEVSGMLWELFEML